MDVWRSRGRLALGGAGFRSAGVGRRGSGPFRTRQGRVCRLCRSGRHRRGGVAASLCRLAAPRSEDRGRQACRRSCGPRQCRLGDHRPRWRGGRLQSRLPPHGGKQGRRKRRPARTGAGGRTFQRGALSFGPRCRRRPPARGKFCGDAGARTCRRGAPPQRTADGVVVHAAPRCHWIGPAGTRSGASGRHACAGLSDAGCGDGGQNSHRGRSFPQCPDGRGLRRRAWHHP